MGGTGEADMKGLDLSRRFYEACGRPMIKKRFPADWRRMATGMAGEGSECLGYDDPVSRDHDWGPGFCIWLTDEDYARIGPGLQDAYDSLPKVFIGFSRKKAGLSLKKVGVFSIREFYERFTGLGWAPAAKAQWLRLSDAYLCACTNGVVFDDPLGIFSQIRGQLLAFYPGDVRRFKLASRCAACAQSGQYNFVRSVQRGESVAASFALNQFCSDILSIVFLLKKKYAPFYKWKHRAVRDLGTLGRQIHDAVSDLLKQNGENKKQAIIEDMCRWVVDELRRQDLSDSDSLFLLDHSRAIQDRIEDETIRKMSVWGG